MVIDHFWFTHHLQFMATNDKAITWDEVAGCGDSIFASLHTVTYVPNQDTHEDFDDLTNEICGGCYVAGGDDLTNENAITDTTPRLLLNANDAAWVGVTITARFAATYDGQPACTANDSLLSVVDFNADETVSAGNFTVQWDCCPNAIAVVCPTNLT